MRVCIYGNPTLDIIIHVDHEKTISYGGGVYYSSIPFLERGFNIEVYSVLSPLIHGHPIRRYIVLRQYSARTNIFLLDYTGSHRRIYVLERSDKLAYWNIHDDICISIVNPVLGEMDTTHLRYIRMRSTLLAVDIQGFIRSVSNGKIIHTCESDVLNVLREADIIHMDREEYDFLRSILANLYSIDMQRVVKGVILITERPNKISLITRDYRRDLTTDLDSRVIDKTGAGDFFLSSFVIHYLKEMNYEESAYKAHIDTSRWLMSRDKGVSSHSHHSAVHPARHL